MTQKETRIAFPSEDGKKISRHFGKAPYFIVARLKPDGEVQTEQRPRESWQGMHESGLIQFKESVEPDAPDITRHIGASMFAGLEDCQVLVSGGMGQGAYDRAVSRGLQVIMTGEWEIEKAIQSYRDGTLTSDERRIHKH